MQPYYKTIWSYIEWSLIIEDFPLHMTDVWFKKKKQNTNVFIHYYYFLLTCIIINHFSI